MRTRLALVCLLLGAAGCGGGGENRPQYPAVTRIDPELPGENCASGGQAVRTGLDRNTDGALQDDEVTDVTYLCADPTRTLLVRTEPEPAGTNCAEGGTAVLSGIDEDGNGSLADGEVDRTTYVCGDAEPAVLVRTSPTAPDATCLTGGTRVESGRDRDASGSLDDGEVEQNGVVCGPDVLVRTDDVLDAAGCHGKGTRVRSGVDTDGDGTLDDAEVTDTAYVCSAEQYGYVVRNQADLDLLDHVAVVRGDLIVESPTLTTVYIYRLVVTGAIVVRDCPALQELSLHPAMIGGDIEVVRTPALTRLSVEINPGTYPSTLLPILGDLTVTDAPMLESIWLDRVPYIQGSLELQRAGMQTVWADDLLDSHRGLEWIGGTFRIEDCDRFQGASMRHLTRIGGSLILRGNDTVGRWDDGMWTGNTLVSVGDRRGGDVVVEDNAAMTSVFLDSLTSVKGGMYFRRNPALAGISHGALAFVGDDYVVEDNAVLGAVGSLPTEATLWIAGWLEVERNPELYGVWLENLGGAGEGIIVRDNAKLEMLPMNVLQQLPSLYLERNAALEFVGPSGLVLPEFDSFTGLVSCDTLVVRANPSLARLALPALTSVRSLTVQDNALLPTCDAEALAAQASPSPIVTTISGNLDVGACP